MVAPKLSKLEFQIMEALWERGESSIRDILDSLPAKAQTGVQHHPNHGVTGWRQREWCGASGR